MNSRKLLPVSSGVYSKNHVFTRRIKELMSDEEYKLLQASLVHKPDAGDIIRSTGGLRKLRWKLDGRGKSGGARIIYYWVTADDQIYMLYAYPKNEQDNLTSDQNKMLKTMVERWSDG